MVTVFVRHTVEDYARWRSVYDEFDAVRAEMGVTGHAVWQALDNPNDGTVTHDFSSQESAEAFAQSQELRSAMQRAGVVGPPEVVSPAVV